MPSVFFRLSAETFFSPCNTTLTLPKPWDSNPFSTVTGWHTNHYTTTSKLRSYRDSNPPSSSNACLLSESFQTVYIGYPIYSGYLFIRPYVEVRGIEPLSRQY